MSKRAYRHLSAEDRETVRRGTARRGQIPTMPSMVARPAAVARRTVPGHWEGDLIEGVRTGSAIGTRVERTSRVVLLARGRGRRRSVPARD
ncbi:MAG: hypothetical protein ABI604_11635 [Nitrospirota bacterium]